MEGRGVRHLLAGDGDGLGRLADGHGGVDPGAVGELEGDGQAVGDGPAGAEGVAPDQVEGDDAVGGGDHALGRGGCGGGGPDVGGLRVGGQGEVLLVAVGVGAAHGVEGGGGDGGGLARDGGGQGAGGVVVAGLDGRRVGIERQVARVEGARQGVGAAQVLLVVGVGHGGDGVGVLAALDGHHELAGARREGHGRGAVDPGVVALVRGAVAVGHGLLVGALEQLVVALSAQREAQVRLAVGGLELCGVDLEHAGLVGDVGDGGGGGGSGLVNGGGHPVGDLGAHRRRVPGEVELAVEVHGDGEGRGARSVGLRVLGAVDHHIVVALA